MARAKKRRKKRAPTIYNRAFGVAARQCHAETTSAPAYGTCMKQIMESITASEAAKIARGGARARPRRKKRR